MPSLTLSNLACSRGGRLLFRDVNCELSAGRWLYVAGANGVGKTSLLRMICGLAPVESGRIAWNGQPIGGVHRDAYHQDLCYLGHLNALQESMTVAENLQFNAALGGQVPLASQISDLLRRFGLGSRERQLVRHLSQGQKRRVALSRLALSSAKLWVLDEPFVAMDEAGVLMLAGLIDQHLEQGGLAVLTSHQQVAIGQRAPQRLELQR